MQDQPSQQNVGRKDADYSLLAAAPASLANYALLPVGADSLIILLKGAGGRGLGAAEAVIVST